MTQNPTQNPIEPIGSYDAMGADEFRDLAINRLFHPSSLPIGDFLQNPEFKDWVTANAKKPAAVLIAIIKREAGLTVLMTKRTNSLPSHSGQVAFAGGKIETGESIIEAALREANEEVGLQSEQVEVIGVMPEYLTGSGFKISPVVGLVENDIVLKANPDEVEIMFEVPLGFLMDEKNHKIGSREFEGKARYFLEMPYGEHYIWGVTAGIIKIFQQRLSGTERLVQE